MNRPNIKTLIAHLSGLASERFNMSVWATVYDPDVIKHDCGTCACIGGWTEALFGDRIRDNTWSAGGLLGLDYAQARALFYPVALSDWSAITTAQAVQVLQHLLDTGEVDWRIIQ